MGVSSPSGFPQSLFFLQWSIRIEATLQTNRRTLWTLKTLCCSEIGEHQGRKTFCFLQALNRLRDWIASLQRLEILTFGRVQLKCDDTDAREGK